VGEQLFAKHRVAAEHVADQLLDFLAERRTTRIPRTSRPLAIDDPRPCAPSDRSGGCAGEDQTQTMTPGMMAIAVRASCQFSATRMTMAMTNRITEIAGDTIAICSRPVVVSTSPVSATECRPSSSPRAAQRQMQQPLVQRAP